MQGFSHGKEHNVFRLLHIVFRLLCNDCRLLFKMYLVQQSCTFDNCPAERLATTTPLVANGARLGPFL